jgi:23S rRNA A1618 N6-methylase RlmF
MDIDKIASSPSTKTRKRAHPDSSTLLALEQKTSSEILALVENPNFEELSRHYPSFQKAWLETRQKQKEFKARKSFSSCVSQEFTVSLTRGLLQAYFHLQLPHLESNHLCPPIPNRFFYLHWIDSYLLKKMTKRQSRTNWGIDIGTGATSIYPLLGASFFRWSMMASDIDSDALSLAKSNITANRLDHKIHLLHVSPSHSQQPSLPPGGPIERTLRACSSAGGIQAPYFDFIITNPPFYDSDSMEHITLRAGDGRHRTSMTVSEGSYPNGEIGFVTEMIADSLQARESSLWFSSMLGKKTSLVKLEKMLQHLLGPAHIETTEYGPGQYTRWFLAWNFWKPSALDGLAYINHPKDAFEVFLEGLHDPQQALSEVASRINVYCERSPGGWSLKTESVPVTTNDRVPMVKLQIKEFNFKPIENFVDESEGVTIPQILVSALHGKHNADFLPYEGHFIIQASVETTITNNYEANGGMIVNVRLACYRHSSRGLKAIEKIRNGMEGEVARTNRKWRRIRQRQH